MKYILLILLSVSLSIVKGQNCRGQINPRLFQVQLQELRRLPQQSMRFNSAMQNFESFCLSSAQVYQVCRMLGQDPYRIDFAYASYPKVIDPQNFYDVYDALELFSSAFRLHDLIGGVGYELVPIPEPIPIPEPAPVLEPICEVTNADMEEVRSLVKSATFKDSMEKQAKMMVKSKQCFSTNQIVDLISVFSYEDSKVMLAKYAFDYCIDTQNYFRVVNSLTFKSDKDNLTTFISDRN